MRPDRRVPRQIFVRTLSGKTITVEAELLDSIDELKVAIELKEGIAPEWQSLSIAGKHLDDDQNCVGLDLGMDPTVHLALALCGGGKKGKHKIANRQKGIRGGSPGAHMVRRCDLSSITTPQSVAPVVDRAANSATAATSSQSSTKTTTRYTKEGVSACLRKAVQGILAHAVIRPRQVPDIVIDIDMRKNMGKLRREKKMRTSGAS